MKIVINECFGGFHVDPEAVGEPTPEPDDYSFRIERDDPRLISAVESGYKGDRFSNLVVVEIPDGTDWHIHEYDGFETIHSAHSTWTSYEMRTDCG